MEEEGEGGREEGMMAVVAGRPEQQPERREEEDDDEMGGLGEVRRRRWSLAVHEEAKSSNAKANERPAVASDGTQARPSERSCASGTTSWDGERDD